MALFLSTYVNKVDKKGRVSVPAQFRAALASETYQGIVVFRCNQHTGLEGFSWSFMEEVGQRLDNFDLFSNSQDDLATAIFGDSVQLPFDGDGRVVLPSELGPTVATVHPSAILRAPDDVREQTYAGFVEDLRAAADDQLGWRGEADARRSQKAPMNADAPASDSTPVEQP